MPLVTWHIKSTTKAVDGLYHYDVVQRLNDARFGDRDVADIRKYIRSGRSGGRSAPSEPVVVLIDEIDKADVEFPNDLLRELDEMAFHIPELDETVRAKHRPVAIITRNAEKELPDAFLRRCVFHYIAFPDREQMERIVRVHHPDLEQTLLDAALDRFFAFRRKQGLRKKPSTSELVDWLAVLVHAGLDPERLENEDPFLGVLLKQEQDLAPGEARRGRMVMAVPLAPLELKLARASARRPGDVRPIGRGGLAGALAPRSPTCAAAPAVRRRGLADRSGQPVPAVPAVAARPERLGHPGGSGADPRGAAAARGIRRDPAPGGARRSTSRRSTRRRTPGTSRPGTDTSWSPGIRTWTRPARSSTATRCGSACATPRSSVHAGLGGRRRGLDAVGLENRRRACASLPVPVLERYPLPEADRCRLAGRRSADVR